MKDFITPESQIKDAGSSLEKNETAKSIESLKEDPKTIRELADQALHGVSEGLERLKALEPQTEEQEIRTGFFKNIGLKLKSAFIGKELSLQDQLVKDIRDLTHFSTSNAGLGGLGNISGGGFAGLSTIAERYGIPESKINTIGNIQKEVDSMDNGPDKVAKLKELNKLKLSVTQDMRASIEK